MHCGQLASLMFNLG